MSSQNAAGRRGPSGGNDVQDGFSASRFSTVSDEAITALTLSELPRNGYIDIGVRWRASDSSRNVLWKEQTASFKVIAGVMTQVGLVITGVDADEIVCAAVPAISITPSNQLAFSFTGKLNVPLTGSVQAWWAVDTF